MQAQTFLLLRINKILSHTLRFQTQTNPESCLIWWTFYRGYVQNGKNNQRTKKNYLYNYFLNKSLYKECRIFYFFYSFKLLASIYVFLRNAHEHVLTFCEKIEKMLASIFWRAFCEPSLFSCVSSDAIKRRKPYQTQITAHIYLTKISPFLYQ